MNVHAAAIARMHRVFDEFEQVVVSFSGGKDSGVMLNLALQVATERGELRKLAVYHMDYEAQYQMTTDYVDRTFAALPPEVTRYWVCLPIKAQCATSMHQDHWIPWDQEKRHLWVRPMPTAAGVISEANAPTWFAKGMWDYDFQERLPQDLATTTGKPVCVLVGIRSQESLNRWRAIHSDRNTHKFNGYAWTRWDGRVCNAYPLFDWLTEDIWTANARFHWEYNRLYDLYHQAGVPLDKMRVASPFNDYATASLHLYRAIDPDNWGRMVGRVNGVNFTGIYGGTTAMGWKSITKPDGHTWKSYMEFLLNSLPQHTADNYRRKLEASKKSWLVGGAMDATTIEQLEAEGAPLIRTGETNKRTSTGKEVVRFADYLDDTTVDDFRRIPTYKRMCICIMKNDHTCKYMGFAQTKAELARRQAVIQKYQAIL